ELEKGRDAGRLAVDILPMRMVVVTGSFPFKDQLEEFRRALRFDSIDDLFRDRNSTPTFLTPEVQRCEYHKGRNGEWVQGRWQKLDFDKTLAPIMLLTGREEEPDDQKLDPVWFNGLVMVRPKAFREKQYPDVEEELPKIKETLDAFKDANKPQILR